MFNAVNNVPDIYLDELQLELQEMFGVSANTSTIWRALKRAGYTMKKVRGHLCEIFVYTNTLQALLYRH